MHATPGKTVIIRTPPAGRMELSVYTLNGMLVNRTAVSGTGSATHLKQDLPAGLYLIRLSTAEITLAQKLPLSE